MLGQAFPKFKEIGKYNPETDIILSPFAVQPLGTDNINNIIAQMLGQEREAVVHQVIAGREKHYLAVGDKVMVDKQVGFITAINRNGLYTGKDTLPESTGLSRFGVYIGNNSKSADTMGLAEYENFDLDKIQEIGRAHV